MLISLSSLNENDASLMIVLSKTALHATLIRSAFQTFTFMRQLWEIDFSPFIVQVPAQTKVLVILILQVNEKMEKGH